VKILIIGNKRDFNAEYFYLKAFNKLGHEVVLLNEYENIKNPLYARILHTRTSLFNSTLGHLEINKSLDEKVRKIDPDVVLIFKGELISTSNLYRISENYRLYLLYPDMYKFRPILKNRLKYFLSVFTAANKTKFYYNLGAKNVVTVPWACDPEFHVINNTDKSYDISFVGTGYLERRKKIRGLNNIITFGDFWPNRKNHHPPLLGSDYIRVINQTKINLNLQAKANIIADAPTMRTFEIAGCGGFQISDYMPSLKRYFPMMPTFTDVGELREQIEYYLDNEEDRDEIALKCMEICRDSFKYTDSAKIILSQMR
jgi:spore maturation protein CgeB